MPKNTKSKVYDLPEKKFLHQIARGRWVGSTFKDHGRTMKITEVGKAYEDAGDRVIAITAVEVREARANSANEERLATVPPVSNVPQTSRGRETGETPVAALASVFCKILRGIATEGRIFEVDLSALRKNTELVNRNREGGIDTDTDKSSSAGAAIPGTTAGTMRHREYGLLETLSEILVRRGLAASFKEAEAMIRAGRVEIPQGYKQRVITDPKEKFRYNEPIKLRRTHGDGTSKPGSAKNPRISRRDFARHPRHIQEGIVGCDSATDLSVGAQELRRLVACGSAADFAVEVEELRRLRAGELKIGPPRAPKQVRS
ncbi:hypothetical protein SBA5_750009 [Candidatus Sulfotelmatomonas gaucii]|uniref:Uncharacterized protein n=1 Tax=Candidatus Sulfuritelmatomonas gaucii TaxID=2043161 RepID=A0A2N9M3N9_9BACT|nr:hypothetical protein SBA5_750009 [Candidatus Sulfotelmatomonas gaucii]